MKAWKKDNGNVLPLDSNFWKAKSVAENEWGDTCKMIVPWVKHGDCLEQEEYRSKEWGVWWIAACSSQLQELGREESWRGLYKIEGVLMLVKEQLQDWRSKDEIGGAAMRKEELDAWRQTSMGCKIGSWKSLSWRAMRNWRSLMLEN